MISIMKHFNKKDWAWTVVIFFLTIIEVFSALMTVEFMEKIVGLVMNKEDLGPIFLHGGIMVSLALFSVLVGILISLITVKISSNYAKRLRGMLFTSVNSFTMEEINKFSTASLITRSTNDIQQVQTALANGLRMIFVAPIIAVSSLVMIAGKSTELTLTTAVAIIILIITIAVVFFFMFPKFKQIQGYNDRLNGVAREHLTGLRVVRAYNAEDYQQAKFQDVNNKLSATQCLVSRTMGLLMPTCWFIMDSLGLVLLWFGSYLINDNLLTLPEMTAFQLYANMVLMAFMMMTMMAIMIPRAAISAKRINEVLDTRPKVVDPIHPITPKEEDRATLEFRHVSFRYPDAKNNAISDINFKLNKGETLAIIGATGSGKTSLINLIPRFYDATEGEVLLDNVNVKDQCQNDIRARLGLVAQKALLFSGTIESNIKYSDADMSNDKMYDASMTAQATEFIEDKEDGYSAHVSQGGKNLSGGQKQRVSIARAVAKDPEIYIFDDSFSALDYATDKKLRNALKAKTENASVIIVAQRIGTIKNADKIIVLENGEMVGYGKHEELLKSCNVYREIALSQLSKEELDNAQ